MNIPFKQFMETQLHRIDVDKWYEGIRIHCDPFQSDYVENWIEKNAVEFKLNYKKSICQHCNKWADCGYKVLTECNEYKKLE